MLTARFQWWRAIILILIFGQSAALAGVHLFRPARLLVEVGVAILELPIAVLIGLLITTPAHAIRLPPPQARRIMFAGSVLLYAIAMIVSAADADFFRPVAYVVLLGGVVVAVGALQRTRISPWWVLAIAWNPLLLAWPLIRR